MKKILINLGNVVATLLMFGPLYIIVNYDNIKNPIFWLICLVLYDIYMYSVIHYNDYINQKKELYEKVKNGKTLNSDTEEKKLQWYKILCDDIFSEHSNNK